MSVACSSRPKVLKWAKRKALLQRMFQAREILLKPRAQCPAKRAQHRKREREVLAQWNQRWHPRLIKPPSWSISTIRAFQTKSVVFRFLISRWLFFHGKLHVKILIYIVLKLRISFALFFFALIVPRWGVFDVETVNEGAMDDRVKKQIHAFLKDAFLARETDRSRSVPRVLHSRWKRQAMRTNWILQAKIQQRYSKPRPRLWAQMREDSRSN